MEKLRKGGTLGVEGGSEAVWDAEGRGAGSDREGNVESTTVTCRRQ